jgi:hypothetical protein
LASSAPSLPMTNAFPTDSFVLQHCVKPVDMECWWRVTGDPHVVLPKRTKGRGIMMGPIMGKER